LPWFSFLEFVFKLSPFGKQIERQKYTPNKQNNFVEHGSV
jgi:hypothetical protein